MDEDILLEILLTLTKLIIEKGYPNKDGFYSLDDNNNRFIYKYDRKTGCKVISIFRILDFDRIEPIGEIHFNSDQVIRFISPFEMHRNRIILRKRK